MHYKPAIARNNKYLSNKSYPHQQKENIAQLNIVDMTLYAFVSSYIPRGT